MRFSHAISFSLPELRVIHFLNGPLKLPKKSTIKQIRLLNCKLISELHLLSCSTKTTKIESSKFLNLQKKPIYLDNSTHQSISQSVNDPNEIENQTEKSNLPKFRVCHKFIFELETVFSSIFFI